MSALSPSGQRSHTEPPLWSIAMAAGIILVIPLALYSLAPDGPFRDGDTVFSNGQQRAQIHRPISRWPHPSDTTCLLDPNSPLIILQTPSDQADRLFLAEVQGNPSDAWPFCPVHAEVWLNTHQVFQKPALLGAVRETLMKFFAQ